MNTEQPPFISDTFMFFFSAPETLAYLWFKSANYK